MHLIHTAAALRAALARLTEEQGSHNSIGFVPTMGALHEGHAALIRRARAENGIVVVSVFVNPLQFGPSEDFSSYPRTLSADAALCETLGVDVVFAPSVQEMYGEEGTSYTRVHVDTLGDTLCGRSRPGHFDGVCTVCTKLFHMVQPQRAYFGKKDAQQWRIVARMVRDLSFPLDIVPCDTVREADGVALSSRNAYLTATERQQAPVLQEMLQEVRRRMHGAEVAWDEVQADVLRRLQETDFRLDYLSLVDSDTLSPVRTTSAGQHVLCAIAAFIGKTRLIDNVDWVVDRA